jgi:TonB family protein
MIGLESALESWMLSYLVNSLWQVPMVFAAAWLATRLVRPIGPKTEHRVWVAALLLEAVLPACRFNLGEIWWALRSAALSLWGVGIPGGEAKIAIGPGIAHGIGGWIPRHVLAGVAIVYAFSILYFAARLVLGVWRTEQLSRYAEDLSLPDKTLGRSAQQVSYSVAVSPLISGPVTVGVIRRTLLLPQGFTERVCDDDLDAVLAHEFAHIERRDFAKNLAYAIVTLPVSYHPVLWLTRSSLAETREMICDSIAADATAGRGRYTRSLLRLAAMMSDHTPARTLHAIGIFDANIFERRVMNLTKRPIEIRGTRRLMIVAACSLVALITCASALALRMDVAPPPAKDENHAPLKRTVNDLTVVHREMPVYPAEAKANKDTLDGSVILHAIIGPDGAPTNIQIVQSLRRDYDISALKAVSEWRWQPYLLNGTPTSVDTTVTITFSIAK